MDTNPDKLEIYKDNLQNAARISNQFTNRRDVDRLHGKSDRVSQVSKDTISLGKV